MSAAVQGRRKYRARCNLIASGLLAMAWPAAAADDPASPMFSFAAFGTLGVVHTDQGKADFVSEASEAVGAGYTHSWSPAVDSLVGAQVTVNPAPRLSAVLQVISQQNYDDTFTPHVEWANLKYQFTPDFSMRLGRTAIGLFLVSDSRYVGFANPWVRPPIEVYGLVSVSNNDGVDASYRLPMGDANNTFTVTYGRDVYRYAARAGAGIGSVTSTYQRGFATLRLNYGRTHVSIPAFDGLFDAFRQFGPEGADIAERYDVDGRLIEFYGLSASYEPGPWFAMAEWGRVVTDSVLGNKTGWYVSGGYRFGSITPYLTYAQVRVDSNTSDPGLNLAGLPQNLAAIAGSLNAGLNASLAAIASQRTVSTGARWDFTRNVDFKLQIDRTTLGANSQGSLTNIQPGFQRGSSLDVFSATMDFVF
jgi:hypothetical protein